MYQKVCLLKKKSKLQNIKCVCLGGHCISPHNLPWYSVLCAFSLKMQMDIQVLGCCLPYPWPHPSPAQGLYLTTSFIKDREQASVHLRPDSQPKTCPASGEELQTREAANCKPLQTGKCPRG